MLKSVSNMKHLSIHASDGEIGHVEEFYFDDETWAVRYLIVNTGGWLSGRLVLISPVHLRQTDWQTRRLHLALTKKQIEHSPSIDTHKPVSRQHEAEYWNYYGSPYYWDGAYLWGAGPLPMDLFQGAVPQAEKQDAHQESADSHLRSTTVIAGYHVEAADGMIGHIEDFIISPDTWNVRYLEVDTHDFLPGGKVLISPEWIGNISWSDSRIRIPLSREKLKGAPEFNEALPITREYENQIHEYYGRPPYWLPDAQLVAKMRAGR